MLAWAAEIQQLTVITTIELIKAKAFVLKNMAAVLSYNSAKERKDAL